MTPIKALLCAWFILGAVFTYEVWHSWRRTPTGDSRIAHLLVYVLVGLLEAVTLAAILL